MARICPECRGEFRDEIVVCPDCDMELVADWALAQETRPGAPDTSPSVTVFSAGDLASMSLAKSILEEAEIPFAVWNERALVLFPSAGQGSPVRARHGQAELQVSSRDAEQARALLEPLEMGE